MDSVTDYESKIRSFFAVSENVTAVTQYQRYDRSLVQILRDANKALKLYECPVSDEALKKLGLDRQTMPPIPGINYYKLTKYSKTDPLWNSSKEEKRPEPENLTMSNSDILFLETALKKLRPATFASTANALILKKIWEYPEAAEIIINAAIALGSATIYADLVFNIRRAEMIAKRTTTFSQMAAKIAVKKFKARLTDINETNPIISEYVFNAISIVAELYRLHIIENSVVNSLCYSLAFKWSMRLNVNEKVRLSAYNKAMIEVGINFITAISFYYQEKENSTLFRLENYIRYLTNLKPSVPPSLERRIVELEELEARNFIRQAPF